MDLVSAPADRRRYGIDAGGSGTSVLAWNGDRWTVPPLNPSSVGQELSQRRLAELFAQLHAHASRSDGPGWRAAEAPAIWLAWAAIDRATADPAARRCASAAREVGLRAQFLLSNDLIPLLISAPAGTGHIIAVCGTGSGFLATNGRSGAVRVGGCEYLGSDEGSAFDLGLHGLRAAVRGLDGRGPPTALSDLLAVQAGEPVADLARSLAQLPFPKSAVAALAPAVLRAWLDGDLVADALVEEAIGELMLGVRAAHDAAGVLPGWRLSVLGGVVTGCPAFFSRLAVAAASLDADQVELISDPAAEVLAALTQLAGSGPGRRPDRRVDRDVWDLSTVESCAEKGELVDIIECDFEFSGFDDHLVKAGTAVYLWNLCRQFRAAGHRVIGLTPAHGLLGRLRERHTVSVVDWHYKADIPVRLDPAIWPGFAGQVEIPLIASAHRMDIEGVEIVFLSGGPLDYYTDSFYPSSELEGHNLGFLKPLIFQVAAIRFLSDMAAPGAVLHLHEPAYHYLIPAALRDSGLVTVSTVNTNMPIDTKVYGPEVRTLLSFLGGDPGVTEGLADPPVPAALRDFLPSALLYEDRPERPRDDYISLLGLVARCADALDFPSRGQLDYALTQAGGPFEQIFSGFSARRELLTKRNRLFVGGCAIGDEWLNLQRSEAGRKQTLTSIGLDPTLPTVYHNARYTVQHKGQQEMFRAIAHLLDQGERFNALLHCLAPRPPADHDIDLLVSRYPDLVRIVTEPMTQPELIEWALASDVCLFPSKFEMDTFLIAMGEAMAAGAVPIATAQQGMRHWGHAFDLADPSATGLALPRSFRVNDPALVDSLCDGLRRMLHMMRAEPARFQALRDRAVAVARQFSWRQTANEFVEIFAAAELSAAKG